MSIRVSLSIEWWRKLWFQLQSLISKSPVMMITLLILTSVSLRYFKAICEESEYILIKNIPNYNWKENTRDIPIIENILT